MQQITYTVGVRRRFGLGTDTYKVHSHRLEILGDVGQLVLSLTDGSEVHIPSIGKRAWRVYPDYQAEVQRAAAVEAEINQKAQAAARAIDMERQHQQIAQLNAQRRAQAVQGPMMGQVPIQG